MGRGAKMTRLCNLSVAVPLAVLLSAVPAAARAGDAAPAPAPAADAVPAEAPEADAPAADAPAADAKPADAAPAQGILSVTSNPNGELFIDGTDTNLTTPVTDLPVAPGKHTLKVVAADGREASQDFEMEAGGSLNLVVALPEAAPEAKPAEVKPEEEKPEVATPTPPAAEEKKEMPWTWMTVAGWSGLGLGTIGLLSGSVVLTTPTDPDQGPLGFGLFGAGVGLVLGGGVLLYLDNELAESPAQAAPAAAPAR
jgi:hypothetical protein